MNVHGTFLAITLLFLSLGFSSSAHAAVCDVDADGDVDRLDLNLIISARNTPASGPDDPRDADGDGMITVLDARTCTRQCTLARCAVIDPVNHPPVIVSTPVPTATEGLLYSYDVDASDPDPDILTYGLDLAPVGMAIDPATGLIQWTPSDVQVGSHNVVARVEDGNGAAATQSFFIDVIAASTNSEPTADAGTNQTVFVGDTVQLDGSGSLDPDGDPLNFSWVFQSVPAGSAAILSDADAVQPTFLIDLPGTYVLELVVNDGQLDSTPGLVEISTENSPPTANAGADQSVLVSDVVTLDGSASIDPDGDAISYSWSFTSIPDGSQAALSDLAAIKPTFEADLPGVYIAQLIVNDGLVDSALDTVTITTQNRPPVAAAGPDQSAFVGDTVALDGSASSDPDGDPLTYSWSFDAVPTGSSAALTNSTAINPAFDIDLVGTYVVQLIVNDGTSDSVADTVVITTQNRPPFANGRAPLDYKGKEFLLAFTQNSDIIHDEANYGWHTELYFTSDTSTLVTIEYPSYSSEPLFEKTVAVNPGAFSKVLLPESVADGWLLEQVQNNTVRAYASEEFIVYLANRKGQSSDAALGIPVKSLNTEYIVADYDSFRYLDGSSVPTQYTVYAVFDNTTVTIEPTKSSQFPYELRGPFTIQLNRGEGYHVESRLGIHFGVDTGLSGTVINADRPIGLVNGNFCAKVTSYVEACDALFEVAVPVHAWGTRIPVVNLPFRSGSVYRIFAADNDTTVTLDSRVIGNVNKGQFIQTPVLPDNHFITADKSILVTQYMTGEYFPGSTLGDPAMVNLPPVSQYRQSHIFSTIGNDQFILHYISIVIENQDIDTILLDGQPIGAELFSPIAGSGFSAAIIPITEGVHKTSSQGVHSVIVEGYGRFDSYIYPVAGQAEFVNSRGDSEPPICKDSTETGIESYFIGSAEDNRDGEDSNGNRFLDPGEDVNGDGLIDGDKGIFSIRLLEGAANLRLSIDPFMPGDRIATYRVDLMDSAIDGRGIVQVMDGGGNFCPQPVDLIGANPRDTGLTTTPGSVGASSAAAQSAILGAGLSVGTITTLYSATVPQGDVISQNPIGGTIVAEGNSVNIVISGGAVTTSVPNVTSLTQAEAIQAIATSRLVIGNTVEETSAIYPADYIVRQNLSAGATVPEGTPVDLVVSIGTNGPNIVAVPNVLSIPQADAEYVISLAKLKVGRIFSTTSDKLPFTVSGCPDINNCYSVPAGHIVTQYPPAGSSLNEGDTVDLIVSAGASLTVVPDVVGMQRDKAIDDVHSLARLTAGVITSEYNEVVPYGEVISQIPAGGETVSEGAPVDLVISIGSAIVTIPNIINLSEAEALAAINNAGLTVGAVTREYHPSVPPGHIINQDPSCGIVESTTPINLAISLGPATVAIPAVTSRSHAYAINAIQAAGLPVGDVTGVNSDTIFAGIVISQNPAPGTVVTGEPVDIVVSLGPVIVAVPDTIGMQEADAIAAVGTAGFAQYSIFRANSALPPGEVIGQSPLGATNAPEGSTIIILVSLGTPASGFVPALIGLSQPVAESILTTVGLATGTVTFENDPFAPAGLVIDQSLDEGIPVATGTIVDLWVSLGPGPANFVSAPNILGIAEAGAVTTINARGLTAGSISYQLSNTVSPGQVIQQFPMGGTSAAINTSVNIIVAADPCTFAPHRVAVTVPDVLSQQRESAIATIQAVGLGNGITTYEQSSSVPQGRVISQFPSGGATVFNGSTVDLVVSNGQLIPVPDVVGMNSADAETALNNSSLYVGTGFRSTESSSSLVAPGHIIAQYPAAGVLVAGSSPVDLVISLGPGPGLGAITVPDLLGLFQTEGEPKLLSLDLNLGTISYRRSAIPSGRIIGQFPLGGSAVPVGTSINITVSLNLSNDPSDDIYVPNLIGLPLADAKAVITQYMFSVGDINSRENQFVPSGHVMEQVPSPGEYLPEGASILLLISLGGGPSGAVTVPDFIGMSETDAATAVNSIGLDLGTISTEYSDIPVGTVFRQSPPPGAVVPEGSAVNFTVSSGPAPVIEPIDVFVPAVVGTQEGYARLTIYQAGLAVGLNTYEFNDSVLPGIILRQSPAGGLLVEEGSEVDLVISRGADTTSPRVTISSNPPIINVGEQSTINIQVFDDTEITEVIVTADSVPLNLIPPLASNSGFYQGITTLTVNTAGFYEVIATATDSSGNIGISTIAVTVRDPADVIPPTVSLASPSENAELTTLTDVIGTATDPLLISYELQLAPAGSGDYRVISSGNTSVVDGKLGAIDPTLLANGFYDLRLIAEDINGLTSSTQHPVYVVGKNKPGRFTISFLDLEVPVSGIPISVRRTYDSLYRDSPQEFGYGWRLDVGADVTYQHNNTPGDGWLVSPGSGGLVSPCDIADETQTHITEIHFSEREFYRFAFEVQMYGIPSVFTGGCAGTASFRQVGGVPGAQLDILGFNDVFWLSGTDELYRSGLFTELYNPSLVLLTTLDGRQYEFNQYGDLKSMMDANGNSLTVNDDGIVHSSGKSIVFTRDGQGRITQITDPLGQTMSYRYDAAEGNLSAFTNRSVDTTTFTYDTSHLLLDIQDPTGNVPLRNIYDASGRLIEQVDADGNRKGFDIDLNSNTTIITDRLGMTTSLVYDERGHVTAAESGDGISITGTYDERGNKTSETDALGNTESFTYDDQDNLLSETDALGNTISYSYDTNNQLASLTDTKGNVTTITYDPSGNPVTISDANGAVVNEFSYDTSGNVAQAKALGGTWNMDYNAFGNITRRTGPGGLNNAYAYDQNGNRLSETVARTTSAGMVEETSSYTYDNNGRLLSVTDPLGNTTRYIYNASGQVELARDPRGLGTTFTYDDRGNLVRRNYPDGTFEAFGYDPENRRNATTDQGGRTTFYEYNSQDKLVRVIHPDGSDSRNSYDQAGNLVSTTDNNGNVTTYEYDGAHRLLREISPFGDQHSFSYNSLGAKSSETDVLGNVTLFEYEESTFNVPRMTRMLFADGSQRTISYDINGRIAAKTDELGNTTSYNYDAAGRLIRVSDALGSETSYTYDEVGNRIAQTDANGHSTTYGYDANGNMISRTLPMGMSETMEYDAAGNLIAKTDFNGETTTFAYDSMNRLVAETRPTEGTIYYSYTPTGKVATVIDQQGITAYGYDERDRVVRIDYPNGDSLIYAYDAAGNRTSLSSSEGTVSYTYDATNRLASVTDPEGGLTSYAYSPADDIATIFLPNGREVHYTYDTRGRLVSTSHTGPARTPLLARYDYLLDEAGNRIRTTESTGRVINYRYDSLYRLLEEDSATQTTYSYDVVGNRMSINGTSYDYDANDRLISTGTQSFSYDNNGNHIMKRDGVDFTQYGYNSKNELILQVTSDGGVTAYQYDAFGNRVSRDENGNITRFIIDPYDLSGLQQVIAEKDGTGATVASYVYGNDLLALRQDIANLYYHYDGLGSTRFLTDQDGVITDTYDYDAFGTLIDSSGATPQSYLFAGEQLDPGLGLYYLRARYMDPALGRFTSSDAFPGSVHTPASLHKYTYAHNNPVNMLDPTGQYTLGGMSISIGASSILSGSALKAYNLGTGAIEIVNKLRTLLGTIPGMKLNKNMTREQLLGGGFSDLGLAYKIGGDSLDLKLSLGEGAVGSAYQVSADMAGDLGKVLVDTYSDTAAHWLADLPAAGQYKNCDFNDWVSFIYTQQLTLELAAAAEPKFNIAQKIIGVYLVDSTLKALMGTTVLDTYSIQPPLNSCVSPFLRK